MIRRSPIPLPQFAILSVLFLALALVLAPPLARDAAAKVFDAKTFTLKNGMQVVVVHNPRAPVITQMVWYKVGSADEPRGQSGIAHFLEHLMFKGTKKFKPGEFSKIVSRNGGRENAFTTQDYTGYFQTVAADRLELMMKLESDRMTHLVLTDALIEPERKVVLEERRSRTDSRPRAILWEQARAALFQNSPYGIPVIGWEHEIRALTRKQILDFYHHHYAPNNAILVVVGDITVEKLKPLAEKYYGVIPTEKVPPRIRPQEPPQRAERRVIRRDARVRQASFGRMYLAPSYNRGAKQYAYALQVLAQLLGDGATSRLNRSLVVDRKVAAWAGAGYDPDAVDLGTFYLYATPRPGVDVKAVEAALDAELAKLLKDGVTAEEVRRAKQQLKDSAIYARDSLSAAARILGQSLAIGRTVADVESWPDRIGEVTVAQVNEAARAVLKRNSSVTAILLPAKRNAAFATVGEERRSSATPARPKPTPAAKTGDLR